MKNVTAELVIVPTPGMGHLLPTVELSKLILHHDHRISITIYIIKLPFSSEKINSYIDSQSQDNPYPTRLKFHTLPSVPVNQPGATPNFFQTYIQLHKPLLKQAVEDRVQAGFPNPAGFVLDMFCTTMMDIANELHVPFYIYFTSGTSLLNLMFHYQSLADDHGVDVAIEFNDPDKEFIVPGFKNPVTSNVVPIVMQDKEHGSSMILNFMRDFRRAKGILVNTFMELESFGIQALLDNVNSDKKFPAIYPVGPILELDKKSRGGSQDDNESMIMQWLDSQPRASVVFLCFGSRGSFEADQVKEIANGLDQSGHRFLWSLRRPPPEGTVAIPSESESFVEALPEGFLDRTAQRGKIITWAPQVSILAHPSVGGFVSHCGWNSTLESLWFGVPMATWPLFAEQQLNAFELVKELGLAVEIRMDYKQDWQTRTRNFTVTTEEVADGVKKLMSMDEEMRKKVRNVSDQGRKSIQNGGSSYIWLRRFIDDVLESGTDRIKC